MISSRYAVGNNKNMRPTPSRTLIFPDRVSFLIVSHPGGLKYFIILTMLSFMVMVPSKSQNITIFLNESMGIIHPIFESLNEAQENFLLLSPVKDLQRLLESNR